MEVAMYNEPDQAPSQGIQRPRIPVKKIKPSRSVYQDDPKTSRPMIPVQSKSRTGNIKRSQHPTLTIGADGPMGRPRLQVRKPPAKDGAPYDQNLDPDY